jgi:hypothetical protein
MIHEGLNPARIFSADQFVRENLFDASDASFAVPSSRDKAHSVSAISSESGVMFGILFVDNDQVI